MAEAILLRASLEAPSLKYMNIDWQFLRTKHDWIHPSKAKKSAKDQFTQPQTQRCSQSDASQLFNATSHTKLPSLESPRSQFEEEMIADAKKLLKVIKAPVKRRRAPILLDLKGHNNLEQPKAMSPERSLDNDGSNTRISPLYDDYQSVIQAMHSNSVTLDGSLDNTFTDADSQEKIARTIAKMAEANAEYEALDSSRRAEKAKAFTSRTNNIQQAGESSQSHQSQDSRFKVSPRSFFASPTGIVSSSIIYDQEGTDKTYAYQGKRKTLLPQFSKPKPDPKATLFFESQSKSHVNKMER